MLLYLIRILITNARFKCVFVVKVNSFLLNTRGSEAPTPQQPDQPTEITSLQINLHFHIFTQNGHNSI